MGAAFTKCCFDVSEDTKKNPVSSAFTVIGKTFSESSTDNETIQSDENVKLDKDVALSQRVKTMMHLNFDVEVTASQQELRLSMQELSLDDSIFTREDSILEDLIREEKRRSLIEDQ